MYKFSLDCRRTPALKSTLVAKDLSMTQSIMSDDLQPCITFSPDTKLSFSQYLHDAPNSRRVSQDERENIIKWLTDPHKRPSSQAEFSRRNYVRKNFAWEEENRCLIAVPKKGEEKKRIVVTEDMIFDTVQYVHQNNGHAGWDYTWRDISTSYYGILRSDVIYLLKQCRLCALNPTKRPKSSIDTDDILVRQ